MRHQIIEDNAGGLHAFVWAHGRIVWGCYNLEQLSSADFLATLNYIESPDAELDELRRWDSLYEYPKTAYDDLMAHEYGWQVIAANPGGKRQLWPWRMGRAGMIAFDLNPNADLDAQAAAAMLGKRTSQRKAASSAANGCKGGRPRKVKTA